MSGLRLVVGAVLVAVAATALAAVADVSWWRALAATAVAAVIIRLGYAVVSGLAQPPPEPPEAGELRKVKITYRCAVCGAEVRMTVAPQEDPEPPRHCMEDMELVAPID